MKDSRRQMPSSNTARASTAWFLITLTLFSGAIRSDASQRLMVASTQQGSIASAVGNYLKPYVERKDFSGAILIAHRGKILISKAYGMANYELGFPNTTKTKFRIASISKQFTAAAVLLLEQRGLLNGQDPIAKFVPDFPRGQQITLANLVTHTSGITGNMETLPEIAQDREVFHSLEDVVAMLKKSSPASDPTPKTRYSNKNFVLLAFIIEKVSGQSYGAFLRQNIFEPLEMKDTGNEEYLQVVRGLASGYEPGISGIDKAPLDDYWNNVGAGSLYSTVEDLYKWDRALYTGRLLTEESRRKMFTPLLLGGYGYGWGIRERFGHKVFTHNGRTPGFDGDISRYPDDDAVTIFLGNIGSGAADSIRQDLGAILFGGKYSEPERIVQVPIDPKSLEQYAGKYGMFPGYSLTVRKVNDHLVLSAEGTPSSVLTPESETTFFMRALYATVIFKKDAEGKISSLIWRQEGEDSEAKKIVSPPR